MVQAYSEIKLFYTCYACINPIPLCYLQLATLTGHTYKVLYLAISPDGQVSLMTCPELCFDIPSIFCSHWLPLLVSSINEPLLLVLVMKHSGFGTRSHLQSLRYLNLER